jgi:DNA-binding MarR family transcriptional regulator
MPSRSGDEAVAAGTASVVAALLDVLPGLVGVATRSIAAVDGDVTVPQYRALLLLAMSGPENLGGLSERLGVHPSTATRLCDRLVAKGLIMRRAGKTDRREVTLGLSRRGQRIVEQVRARLRVEFARIVGRIPPSKRNALLVALTQLASAMGDTTGETLSLDATY